MIKKLWRRFLNNHLWKFIFVGILNTVVGYGAFAFFVLIDLHYTIALTLSSIIGIIHSYFWNKYFVFKILKKSFFEVLRFVSTYGVVYVANLLLLFVFVDVLHMNELIAQAVILFFVTVISFLGHKFWSFKIKENG